MAAWQRSRKQARAWIALGILLACCGCAFALDPSLDISQYAHTAWKAGDGFSKGIIYTIDQTSDGYLWLGTEFGLFRFDGVRAVPWQPTTGEHLPSGPIRRILVARDGTLWIGTSKGLASWNKGKLTQHPELAGQQVGALVEDREGTIWVGTGQVGVTGIPGKLCAIHGGNSLCYGENGSLGQAVYSLYEDSKGNLWAGAATGLWQWKPGPPKLYPLPKGVAGFIGLAEDENGVLLINMTGGVSQLVNGRVEPYPLLAGRKFSSGRLLRDRDGGLWIATHGQSLLHVHQGRTDVFTQSDGLSGEWVTNLFEDREGDIWVATLDGLDRFRDFAVPTISTKQGLSNAVVLSVTAADDGSIWLGTIDGLNRWKDGQVTVYRKRNGLPDDDIQSLFQDDHGRIVVSTLRGVAYLENNRFIPLNIYPGGFANPGPMVHSMAADRAGNLWISDEHQGIFHLLGGRLVEQIPWDRLGHQDWAAATLYDPVREGLWLGFTYGGLAFFKDGEVREYFTGADGLGAGRVDKLRLDRDGSLWAATEGGLSRVKNGRVATLSSKNGLPCDAVHWMMEDDARSMWLYTACGLLRIPRSELDAWITDSKHTIQATVFDNSDGVRSHSVAGAYTPHVAKAVDGKMWFPTFDGISVIDPRHLPFNKLPPLVHIEQVTADGKTYWQNFSGDASSSQPRLPPLVRDLTIDYTALSFVSPEKVLFRYKLEDMDRDWHDAGNRRQAFYTNLSPGNYRFRVAASNNSGVWNEAGTFLDFSIAPAYYQTNWFRGLCAATFLALLWALYQFRVLELRRQERKLRDVIETIPTFAWTALPDGSVDFVNRNWQEYTGLPPERTLGSGWQQAAHPEDLVRNMERWHASMATGEPYEDEVRYRRAADGQYRRFLSRAVPYRDRRGKILKWYGTSADIEDGKRAEEEREKLRADLAHMNRLSILGELAASLSHELKQPIAAAMTNAKTCMRWLKRDQPDVMEALDATNRIVKAGTRATEIIDRLRSLYKKSTPHRELVDVNEIVYEMLALLQDEANRYSIATRTELATDLPKITADRVQLQQVLMNLMLNAIEAMKDTAGELTIKTELGGDGQLLISVTDTGVGLSQEHSEQIFNAFFTTKPQGSGMGLSISRSIIESHGGRLWAADNSPRGAKFYFRLPTIGETRDLAVPGDRTEPADGIPSNDAVV